MDNNTQLVYLQMLLDRGYKFKFKTELFGKSYVWMEDTHGTVFLERVPDGASL